MKSVAWSLAGFGFFMLVTASMGNDIDEAIDRAVVGCAFIGCGIYAGIRKEE